MQPGAESFIESPKVRDNMVRYHYVDVLFSQKDCQLYAGCTQNVLKRLEQHNSGQVQATKRRLPMKLTDWEGCINQQDTKYRDL